MSSSPTSIPSRTSDSAISFQSAVAHELFSDYNNLSEVATIEIVFQSAVAHELFSDAKAELPPPVAEPSFKALSRMSSSPTELQARLLPHHRRFQSAVAHELFSDASMNASARSALPWFQSAVAHELFSDVRLMRSKMVVNALFQSAVAHELFSD